VVAALDTPLAAVPHFEAAAAGWAALGQPFEHARALAAVACALVDGGDATPRTGAAARDAAARLAAVGATRELTHLRRHLRRYGLRLRPTSGDAAPAPAAAHADAPSLGLTVREREVLGLLALGRTNKEIGRTLGIAEKTVRIHVTHLLAKLGCTTRTEAARVAFQSGVGVPATLAPA
jgi:DNA-binding NarL/FixJ family response regulator